MAEIPWKDEAVLIRVPLNGERIIELEGSLRTVVDRLAAWTPTKRSGYAISLPDRRIAPFAYKPNEFDCLIIARSKL